MSRRIKGITLEIGGDTTELEKSLKDISKDSQSLSRELRDVNKLLNFDPGNVKLLAQQQEILEEQIEKTTERLKTLKNAQEEVERQFKSGEIDDGQYRAFNREIEDTESRLKTLNRQLESSVREQENLESATRDLQRIFDLTGKEIDDFEDILGTDLVNAIKDGKASSNDLRKALGKIGDETLGAKTDVDKLSTAIRGLDDNASINDLKIEMGQFEKATNEADTDVEKLEGSLSSLGNVDLSNLTGLIGGIGAGALLKELAELGLGEGSIQTKLDIVFTGESKRSAREAVSAVKRYGVEGEEALEAVRLQFALNKDVSDEANQKLIEQAGAVSWAYSEIDLGELIRETYEISSELGITNEEALALVNHLLSVGFPPGELDIIAEYGGQLSDAGYSAEQIQAIFASGLDTGTWNIDNLMDGLKEGRIRMVEFSAEIDEATKTLIKSTGLSTGQFKKWADAIASGGEEGAVALQEVAEWLLTIEDDTKRAELATKIFGTMYEDQGDIILETLANADKHLITVTESQEKLNQAVEKVNSDNIVRLSNAWERLKSAIAPIGDKFVGILAGITDYTAEFLENPAKGFGTLQEQLSRALTESTDEVIAKKPMFRQAATGLAFGMAEGWELGNPEIQNRISRTTTSAVSAIQSRNDQFVNVGSVLANGLATGWGTSKGNFFNELFSTTSGGERTILNSKGRFISAGLILGQSLTDGTSSQRSSFINVVNSAVNAGASSAKSRHRGTFVSTGKSLMDGLIYGVDWKYNAVVQAIRSPVIAGINAARAAARISSPSKETEYIMDMMMEGYIRESDRRIGDLEKVGKAQMEAMLPSVPRVSDLPSVNSINRATSSYQGGAIGGDTFNINISIENATADPRVIQKMAEAVEQEIKRRNNAQRLAKGMGVI